VVGEVLCSVAEPSGRHEEGDHRGPRRHLRRVYAIIYETEGPGRQPDQHRPAVLQESAPATASRVASLAHPQSIRQVQTKTQTLLRIGAVSLAEDLQFSEAVTRVHFGPPKTFALGYRLDMQLHGCI
jgi:hypothetical protein